MEIKKTLKIIGASIVGVFIAVASWLLNNFLNKKRNYEASKEHELKENLKEDRNEVDQAVKNVDQATQKLEEIKQKVEVTQQQTGTTEQRLENLEAAGVISKRVKKDA